MSTWIFSMIFLVSAVAGYGDEWWLVHWSKSEEKLLKCLNDTKLPEVLNENIIYAQEREYVLIRLAYLFHRETEAIDSVRVFASDFINVINGHLYQLHQQTVTEESLDAVADIPFDEDQKESVKEAIITALLKCADPEDSEIGDRMVAPPRFLQDIPEVAELLNMILVHNLPERFVSARTNQFDYSGFTVFHERALLITEIALRRMNNARELFKELWNLWKRRAGLFYLDKFGRPVYLRFRFSPERARVFVFQSDVIHAEKVDVKVHFAPAPNDTFVFDMTRYCMIDWRGPRTVRLTSVPSSAGSMTRPEYFLKRQIHQFFQGLFAYLESVGRGLGYGSRDNQWVAFKEELPMLWTDSLDGYEAYLRELQSRELSHEFATNSPLFATLARFLQPGGQISGEQINEFDLALMYWHRLRSDYFIYKLIAKGQKISKLLRMYWNHLRCVDIVNIAAKNWHFKDKLGGITNLLMTYWRHLRSPQTLALEDQSPEFSEAGPSNFRTTTTVTTTTTTTFSSSTDSSSKKGKGSVTKLPSGKYVWKNHKESIDDDSSSYYSASDDECESFLDSNDVTDGYFTDTVETDDSENDFILTSEFLHDTLSTLFKRQINAKGDSSCF